MRSICTNASARLNRVLKPLKRLCLPALSLMRTPGGRYCEWSGAFFEPCMEFCERSVWLVGLVCFILVLMGISTVVATMYLHLVPYMWATYHPLVFTAYITYGHYLLVNICFHYFKGVYTSPGSAPKVLGFQADKAELKKGWNICKKCEGPKPPRAHHCRICNTCVLKMDHHCPWMFNCIGHNNYRYFLFFIIYMWLGTSFVIHTQWARVMVLLNMTSESVLSFLGIFGLRGTLETAIDAGPPVGSENALVIMVFFICLGVTVALTILGGWHMYLISVSETTIEFYLNKRDARRLKKEGKKFHNPYSYGFFNNWIFFLGLVNGRSLLRNILLPSSHPPHHDGIGWEKEDILNYKDKPRAIPV